MKILIRLFAVIVVAFAAGAAYAYVSTRHVSGPITGLPVSRSIANRRPIAVMIDNFSPDARPQSGLADASMVFETLTEGGITRFMAVFLEHDSPKVGPVRSTRYYYNSWAAGLGVIFGHDGGNVDALQELKTLTPIYNIDADRVVGPFYRTTDRAVPHNEYTSTTALRNYASAHGGAITGAPTSFQHKSDASPGSRPAHFTLDIGFSYGDYNVEWRYNPSANDYLRFMGGAPHVDAATGKQLTAKNIIVMRTEETAAYDPFTAGAIHLRTEGSGPMTLYRDGQVINGTWQKASVNAPLQWLDSTGTPVQLDRGNIWVEVVPNGQPVTTSPS